MKSNKISFLSFSDVHHGSKSYTEMYNEFYTENGLMPVFHELVFEEDFLGVFLTGDYYDKKLDLNDNKAKLASQIILELYTYCKKHNKYFIILKGTYAHEFNQLDNFKFLESTYSKFKIINTVTSLQLDNNIKILCLPEEYMNDQESYYEEYFSEKYNIILGHGLFSYNKFHDNISERPMANMPMFNEKQLMKLADIIIFGHVHTPSIYKNKIYYNGSYSRLCFGEEEPKGYWLFDYYYKTNKHEATFIENVLAPKYKTILLEQLKKINSKDLDLIVKEINNIKKQIDYLKIKISKEFTEENLVLVENIKTYFYNKSNIVIEGGSFSLKNSSNIINSENQIEKIIEYDFLYTTNDLNTKILKFIDIKHKNKNIVITEDDIKEALSVNEDE
jgi:DNA repair exonuclease SbcCD nuclease subunit